MDEYPFFLLRRRGRVDHFCNLINRVADHGESFAITKEGQPVAVVISVEEFEGLRDVFVMQEVRDGETTDA